MGFGHWPVRLIWQCALCAWWPARARENEEYCGTCPAPFVTYLWTHPCHQALPPAHLWGHLADVVPQFSPAGPAAGPVRSPLSWRRKALREGGNRRRKAARLGSSLRIRVLGRDWAPPAGLQNIWEVRAGDWAGARRPGAIEPSFHQRPILVPRLRAPVTGRSPAGGQWWLFRWALCMPRTARGTRASGKGWGPVPRAPCAPPAPRSRPGRQTCGLRVLPPRFATQGGEIRLLCLGHRPPATRLLISSCQIGTNYRTANELINQFSKTNVTRRQLLLIGYISNAPKLGPKSVNKSSQPACMLHLTELALGATGII